MENPGVLLRYPWTKGLPEAHVPGVVPAQSPSEKGVRPRKEKGSDPFFGWALEEWPINGILSIPCCIGEWGTLPSMGQTPLSNIFLYVFPRPKVFLAMKVFSGYPTF
jgi:hypothetical protein